jgi:hypothetical protein
MQRKNIVFISLWRWYLDTTVKILDISVVLSFFFLSTTFRTLDFTSVCSSSLCRSANHDKTGNSIIRCLHIEFSFRCVPCIVREDVCKGSVAIIVTEFAMLKILKLARFRNFLVSNIKIMYLNLFYFILFCSIVQHLNFSSCPSNEEVF